MNSQFTVPSQEIENRRLKIQKEMVRENVEGLFIVQRVDLFYFSGTAQNAFLYIPVEGEPLLFVKKYLPRARLESPIKEIVEIQSVKEIPGLIREYYETLPAVLGLEFDVLPVSEFKFYGNLFGGRTFVDASPMIQRLRMIKSDWEIAQIEHTADRSSKIFDYMRRNIRAGLTEMELPGLFEPFARTMGYGARLRVRDYQTEGYPWHILSGRSGGIVGLLDSPASGEGPSAAFPCGGGSKRVVPNEPIMIDFNFVFNGYHMDETRMFAIHGMPSKALKASRAIMEIHNEVLGQVKPGRTLDELFQTSVHKAEALGYERAYLGPPGYKVRFIGHGIGLELIEHPIIAQGKQQALEPGMVFALEPKMVFQGEFAAGIESVFLVTETGYRLMSKVPVDVFVC
jgi:Xaa-Pro dipeptidase